MSPSKMDEYKKALKENIKKVYALSFVNGAMFFWPIIILFWQDNGLSLQDIFILEAIFAIGTVIWEIPSGYLSDRWGRKNTLVAGSVLSFLGILFLAFGTSFSAFLLAQLVLACAVSFYSGTLDAIIYDSLIELDEVSKFKKIVGQNFFSFFGAEALVSIAGGLLAIISLRTPIFATLIPFGIAILISITLEEPKRHKMWETRHLHAMINITKSSLITNIPLRSFIALQAILTAMFFALFFLTQPYQLEVELPLALFGVTHAVIVATGALVSKYTHLFTKRFDDRFLLLVISGIATISFLTLGVWLSIWGLILFMIARMAWSALTPLSIDIINRMTTSDVRATVLSMRAFTHRIVFACTAPFVGYAADMYSLNTAILITGIIGIVVIAIIFLLMRRVWKDIPR